MVACCQSLAFGIIALAITTVWAWDTFSTTCRRCPFYDSTKCGIPSFIVPFFFKRKSAFSISLNRVRLHYYADAAMIVFVNFVYAHVPVLFPIVALCSLIGWLTVFRPKKYHGLLFRLTTTDTRAGRNYPEELTRPAALD